MLRILFSKRRSSRLLVLTAALSIACQLRAAAGPVAFQQAVQDYSSGKYALALSEFEPYKAANPNNALVRYYMALCHQSLNHMQEARAEFEWVGAHADPKLAAMAKAGFAQLSRMSGSGSASSATPTIASSSGAAAATTKPAGKVKKVIEFYADW